MLILLYTGFSVIKDKCAQQAPVYCVEESLYDRFIAKSYCEGEKNQSRLRLRCKQPDGTIVSKPL